MPASVRGDVPRPEAPDGVLPILPEDAEARDGDGAGGDDLDLDSLEGERGSRV